ncbi:MAG: ErfK/YbiS/YcfS/YnhG family protein [Tardiphaga sp.]|nr:ErfK/YbiS/YcfS/YnhG family protein [Tardiphaga sp.]
MILCFRFACHPIAALMSGALSCIGVSAQAATPLYWPGSEFGYDRPAFYEPRPVMRQPRMPKQEAAKAEQAARKAGKPTGPLVIAISLERQTMKVYDANGVFAETPISSGMKGHSTPTGVFSVIQKNKWHRSNIYSGAPMPYMQRLTWSGIAMHAGALPGYPASHGCVRMPMGFAVQMWNWTRMGARVVITPGEISPASFTHPLLVSIKPAMLVAAAQPVPPQNSVAGAKTADASGAIPSATVSDASAIARPVVETKDAAAVATDTAPVSDKPVADKAAADKPAQTETAAAPAAKRGGPIAIYVSGKDGKLYVRQNFAPLFDVSVTISGDQPLGTHVFTAQADKDVTKPVQWTALTLPAGSRGAEETTLSRRRQTAGAISTQPAPQPASPSDALDRLSIPAEVLARLGDALTTGSSLIVSDQAISASGETGDGTDFIVRLR